MIEIKMAYDKVRDLYHNSDWSIVFLESYLESVFGDLVATVTVRLSRNVFKDAKHLRLYTFDNTIYTSEGEKIGEIVDSCVPFTGHYYMVVT